MTVAITRLQTSRAAQARDIRYVATQVLTLVCMPRRNRTHGNQHGTRDPHEMAASIYDGSRAFSINSPGSLCVRQNHRPEAQGRFRPRFTNSNHSLPPHEVRSGAALEVLETGTSGAAIAMWTFSLPANESGQDDGQNDTSRRHQHILDALAERLQHAHIYRRSIRGAHSAFGQLSSPLPLASAEVEQQTDGLALGARVARACAAQLKI